MFQHLQQMSVKEYIEDYIKFGVFNGLFAATAYLKEWDSASENEQKVYLAKIISEYGRAAEEIFAHLFAMVKQVQSESLVYWKHLINYKSPKLRDFVTDSSFDELASLLQFPELGELARALKMDMQKLETALSDAAGLLNDLKVEIILDPEDSYSGQLQSIYNKLKHPCLLYSTTPDDNTKGFGILQPADKTTSTTIESEMPFSIIPIMATKDEATRLQSNIAQIAYTLILLLKCFVASYEIRFGK